MKMEKAPQPLKLPPIHFYSETAEPPDVTAFDGGRVPAVLAAARSGTRGHVTLMQRTGEWRRVGRVNDARAAIFFSLSFF